MSRVALVALLFVAGCLGPADEAPPAENGGVGGGASASQGAGADGPAVANGPGDGEGTGHGSGDGSDPAMGSNGGAPDDADLMDRIEAAIEQALRDA